MSVKCNKIRHNRSVSEILPTVGVSFFLRKQQPVVAVRLKEIKHRLKPPILFLWQTLTLPVGSIFYLSYDYQTRFFLLLGL